MNALLTAPQFLDLFEGFHTLVSKPEKGAEIIPWHFVKADINEIGSSLWAQNNSPQFRGIYFTVNEIDQDLDKGLNHKGFQRKRTKKMLKTIRAIFCDDDESGEYRDDFPLPPSIVLQSSPSKFQYFWLTTTDDWKEWEAVQNTIVEQYAGDNQAKDRVRILRIPGFYHNKAEPFMVKAFVLTEGYYDWSTIVEAFPPTTWEPEFEKSPSGLPVIINSKHVSPTKHLEILQSGEHLHGPCSRMSLAFANFGMDAEYIWNQIAPTLENSEARHEDHKRHNDWQLKINGGLLNDIQTAVSKYSREVSS